MRKPAWRSLLEQARRLVPVCGAMQPAALRHRPVTGGVASGWSAETSARMMRGPHHHAVPLEMLADGFRTEAQGD